MRPVAQPLRALALPAAGTKPAAIVGSRCFAAINARGGNLRPSVYGEMLACVFAGFNNLQVLWRIVRGIAVYVMDMLTALRASDDAMFIAPPSIGTFDLDVSITARLFGANGLAFRMPGLFQPPGPALSPILGPVTGNEFGIGLNPVGRRRDVWRDVLPATAGARLKNRPCASSHDLWRYMAWSL